MSRYVEVNEFRERISHYKLYQPELYKTVLKELRCCRTADVVPVVRGHWIEMQVSSGRDSWQCSICGRRTRGKLVNLPYCHCGAKMDEVSE